jgi:hypothetical protein
MDFRIYSGGTLIVNSASNNKGVDPVVFISLTGTGTAIIEFEFSLCTAGTSPPRMKWISFESTSNIEYDTQSSTSFGHPNAAFTAGVGAAFFQATPSFGRNPPQLQSFSSRGGTPILFDRSGARLATNELRMQPRFVATDGCINTFFGQQRNFAPNGLGYYFFGMFLHFFSHLSHESLFVSLLDDSLVS